jgi:hypothetical protein
MQPQRVDKLTPQPLQLNTSHIEDELSKYRQKIAELEQQEQQRKLQEIEREKRRKEQEKKEKAANALFEALDKMGIQLPDQESKKVEPVAVETTKISTQKGLFLLTGIFVFFFAFFALYGSFASLNDSEVRINNAAYIHFISHIWLAVSVILSGVAVQYLLFNMQARYFWSNIETQNSFVHDFQKPTYEGVIRMGVCLFTFAFPTFIIAYIFQLILG